MLYLFAESNCFFYTFCCLLNWKFDGSKYCIIKTVKSIQMCHFLLVYRPSLYFKAIESQNTTTWTQTNFLIRYEYFQSHSLTHTVRYSARITVMQLPTQESLLSMTSFSCCWGVCLCSVSKKWVKSETSYIEGIFEVF